MSDSNSDCNGIFFIVPYFPKGGIGPNTTKL